MKNIKTIHRVFLCCIVLLLVFCNASLIAQTPQAISYQAVARDNSGTLISNQNVSLRFSIHNGSSPGTIVYQETQSVSTNSLGLFTVNIGLGTVVTGNFATINWGNGSKFMQMEIDFAGGSIFTDMGTSQIMSVPYALYANSAGSAVASRKTKIAYHLPPGTQEGNGVANVWTTRTLNTIQYDDIGVTLASNQITLPAGSYEVSAYCVFCNRNFGVGNEKIRMQNITAGTTVAISLNSSMSVAANNSAYPAMINNERFTLNSTSNLALQYYIDSGSLAFVVGYPGPGQTEVYAEIIFTKIQ